MFEFEGPATNRYGSAHDQLTGRHFVARGRPICISIARLVFEHLTDKIRETSGLRIDITLVVSLVAPGQLSTPPCVDAIRGLLAAATSEFPSRPGCSR